jgi:hypothetical protein
MHSGHLRLTHPFTSHMAYTPSYCSYPFRMSSHFRSPMPGSSKGYQVIVELDLSSDESMKPVQPPPKRRRGRPKAAPTSIEFKVQRAPPLNLATIEAFARVNDSTHAAGPRVNRSESPLPEDYARARAFPDSQPASPRSEDNGTKGKSAHKV